MRETWDVSAGAVRLIKAVGDRVAAEDPSGFVYLAELRDAVDAAYQAATDGLREVGYNDAQIGAELGMTRQAVQKRWPRKTHVVGAGARYAAR